MKQFARQYLLIILLLALLSGLHSEQLSKDVVPLETLWSQGKLDDLAAQMYVVKAQTDEDRAFLSYINSRLKTQQSDFIVLSQQTIDRFPNTYYGQLSMLEKAKLLILDRDYVSANRLLSTISIPELAERYYWMALTAQATDDAGASVSYCESYLRLSPMGKMVEETYYILVDSQKRLGKYQEALSSLNLLKSKPGYPKNQQLFYYQQGLIYRKLDNYLDALVSFRAGFELNRSSQLSFLIEDNLFELKDRFGDKIDLGFLYPYADEDTLDPTMTSPPQSPPSTTDKNKPLKLSGKPVGGYFIQAGRFSNEANAEKLSTTIRNLNIDAGYFEDKGNKSTPWVVICGPYKTKAEADITRQTLIANDIECFVTNL